MTIVSRHAKVIGSLVAGLSAALAFAFPAHASEFVGACTTLLAALHINVVSQVPQ